MVEDLRSNVYKDDDKQIRETRAVREFKDEIDLPGRWVDTEVRDPTVADEIGRVSETLSVNPPRWRVATDPAASEDAIRNATKREKWAEGIFDVCGRGQDGGDSRLPISVQSFIVLVNEFGGYFVAGPYLLRQKVDLRVKFQISNPPFFVSRFPLTHFFRFFTMS